MLQLRQFLLRPALLAILLPVLLAFSTGSRAGQIVWWGQDSFWKNSYSSQTNGVIEYEGEIVGDVVAIAARQWQGLALRKDGTVFEFGRGFSEQSSLPPGLSNVASIAMEGNSSWAIKRDGTVAPWGGDEDSANIVPLLTNVSSIAWVGYRSYFALKADGTLIGFRFDVSDPSIDPVTGLSVPLQEAATAPVKVNRQILSNITAATFLGNSPIILQGDGMVFSLEEIRLENRGAFATSSFQYESKHPVEIDGKPLRDVSAIAGSGTHLLALRSNGTVVAWGNNQSGQCNVPTSLSNVVAVAAAEYRSLALKRDGTVVAWGGNFYGETSVPAGLSNVVAIAAGGFFSLAVTTGAIPASVYVRPHGRLEELEREADFIFKGQVISSKPATNASFPDWGKPHATQFKVISVLKGSVATNAPIFWHNTSGPMAWGGGSPPSEHQFESGQCYLVFAVNLDKPAYLYSPPPDATNRLGEFRQTYRDGVTHTLDARPVDVLSAKTVHWMELNRLLKDANPTNSLYAIHQLHLLSKGCGPYDDWSHSEDFKREAVLEAVVTFVTNANDQVAVSAMGCFEVGGNHIDLFGDLGGPFVGWMPMVRGYVDVPPECVTKVSPYAEALVAVANSGSSSLRRVAAIAALSCTRFPIVSNSLPRWLADSAADVRAQAVWLLPDFPGEYCERALRERAADPSSTVRAAVADAIGNGKIETLLPTLEILFSTSPIRTNSGPWPHKYLQGGGVFAEIGSDDIHASAGYALQKFELNQVGAFFKTNLNDPIFGTAFLRKLAENDPGP